MDRHQQQEESLFENEKSSIVITVEDDSLIGINATTIGALQEQQDLTINEGRNERIEESSIMFQEESSTFIHPSPITNKFGNKEDEASLLLSNLDISKISNKEDNDDDHQDRSLLHNEFATSVLLNTPLRHASINNNNSTTSLPTSSLISTSIVVPEKARSRSRLHLFSVATSYDQNNRDREENINEKSVLAESMGNELAKIICEKKPRDSIPLLSIICNLMDRPKAESMIGRTVGRREWGKAKRHSIFPGAGEPFEKNFWTNHRKRISNMQLVQFMEWLKAADLIQNLSFGHKVITYHNGLHVAIESVKRTDSLKNIVNKYYSEFLGIVQNVEEVEGRGENLDDDATSIDTDTSDFDAEEDQDSNIDLESDGTNCLEKN